MTPVRPGQRVVVLGAGMVGIACAISLARRGLAVTVLDPLGPGAATSFGNAGVLARSSLMPFNHPGLWSQLPALLRGQQAGFRYNPAWLLNNWRWTSSFLFNARSSVFRETCTSLDGLIRLSVGLHRQWMQAAGVAQRRRDNGWLLLYRSEAAFQAQQRQRATLDHFGVAHKTLNTGELLELEPHLRPVFERALWVQDASSVDSPGEVVLAYSEWLRQLGGQWVRMLATGLQRGEQRWSVPCSDGLIRTADHVVLALGPWSKGFLHRHLGLSLPMGFERGQHRHFHRAPHATLHRPVYDTAGGYVMAPMAQGVRLTTGVELNAQHAPPALDILNAAEQAARHVFPLDGPTEDPDWLGSRPTLPDGRPLIGACPGHAGLWLALGHQHIGFSTGPGTGELLAQLMLNEAPALDPHPFRPQRFLRG